MWKRVQQLLLSLKRVFPQQPLEIYTDGSSKRGIGAWAFVILQNNKVICEKSGRLKKAGNNQMEFQAAIEALQQLPKNSTITLFSDSRILVDAATKKERPTRFKEQLEQLDVLSKKHTINWKWIKAHSGIRHNERCDELCIQARI